MDMDACLLSRSLTSYLWPTDLAGTRRCCRGSLHDACSAQLMCCRGCSEQCALMHNKMAKCGKVICTIVKYCSQLFILWTMLGLHVRTMPQTCLTVLQPVIAAASAKVIMMCTSVERNGENLSCCLLGLTTGSGVPNRHVPNRHAHLLPMQSVQ